MTYHYVLIPRKIKNGGRGIKPAFKFMVITSLLAVELKATLDGNPTN